MLTYICTDYFLRKIQTLRVNNSRILTSKTWNFIKKRLQHRCFPANIAKFLKTTFFIKHLWWLLLKAIGQFWLTYAIYSLDILVVYGVNTGFGKFAKIVIPSDKLRFVWLNCLFCIKICSFISDNCAHISIKKNSIWFNKKIKGDNLLPVIMDGVTRGFHGKSYIQTGRWSVACTYIKSCRVLQRW